MNFTPVQSSQIEAYAYENSMLVIRFKGGLESNKAYGYPDAPAKLVAGFSESESKGAFFRANIKPNYPRGQFIILNADGSKKDEG